MLTSTAIRRRFQQVVQGAIALHGFSASERGGSFVRPRHHGGQDRVLLLTDVEADGSEVSCTANLSVSSLDEFAASRATTTLTRNVGFLMPARRWCEWRVSRDALPDEFALGLADAIVRYGIPWLVRFTDHESICRELNSSPVRHASSAYGSTLNSPQRKLA